MVGDYELSRLPSRAWRTAQLAESLRPRWSYGELSQTEFSNIRNAPTEERLAQCEMLMARTQGHGRLREQLAWLSSE